MHYIKLITVLTLITLASISKVSAQELNERSNTELISEIKLLIDERMEQDSLVGVSAAIIFGDSYVWKDAFGFADKENNIPMTTETNVCIGSVTKPFTAFGIMQLHEKGLLNIDAPLNRYLPQFTIKTRRTDSRDITVKSLLTHSSGIPRDIFLHATDDTKRYTDMLDYTKNMHLNYPPNTVFHYSNIAYCILGHAIFEVSGEDYPLYLERNIFKPIGMDNTGFVNYQVLNNVSKTYKPGGIQFKAEKNWQIPSGGLNSSVDDLVKFARELIAIYHGKRGSIMKPETLREIFMVQNGNMTIPDYKMGLGWQIFKNDSSLTAFHYGSINVSDAALHIYPEQKMAVIVLVNTAGGMSLAADISNIITKECHISPSDGTSESLIPYFKREISKPNKISVERLKKHCGTYLNTRYSCTVRQQEDKLVLSTDKMDLLLNPITDDVFVPSIMYSVDSSQILPDYRIFFRDTLDYYILYQSNIYTGTDIIGNLSQTQEIGNIWKNRLGRYKVVGYNIESYEKFDEAELFVSNNILQLKLLYTSGEYVYNMIIETDTELTFCGFMDHGGNTITFTDKENDSIMTIFGLTLKKIE